MSPKSVVLKKMRTFVASGGENPRAQDAFLALFYIAKSPKLL